MADAFDVEALLDGHVNENSKETVEDKESKKSHRRDRDRDGDDKKDERKDRDRDREKDRDRDREKDRERDRDRDRERDRDRDRGSRKDRDRDRSRSKERSRRRRDSRDRSRERDRDRDRRRRTRSSSSRSRSKSEKHRKSRKESRSRSRSSSKRRESKSEKEEKVKAEAPKIEIDVEALKAQKDAERRKKEIEDLTKDQRTIFVSQLTKKVNERDLENFFGQIGKVNNVILLRDKFTGAHKGFAYVEMEELEHIPNCLLFNNVVPDFQKFPILVKASEAEKNFIARKDPFSKQYEGLAGPDSRIYLGNIHVSLDETALKAVLEQFGPVESIKLHRDHLGNSKGFAFVKFLRSDSAQVALAALPGLELAGRALKVGHVTETGAGGGGKSNDSGLVGSSFANDSANSANWKLDADEGGGGLQLNAQSRMMLMAKLAQNAGIQMPAAQVLPPSISAIVNNPPKSVPPVSGTPSRFVLITNMFDPATETEPNWDHEIKEDVSDECSNFGPVEYCYVEKSKPGGLVFIRMKTVDGATKASNALNGRYFAGRMITCSFLEEKTFNDMTR